jgi:hypothetical protein
MDFFKYFQSPQVEEAASHIVRSDDDILFNDDNIKECSAEICKNPSLPSASSSSSSNITK